MTAMLDQVRAVVSPDIVRIVSGLIGQNATTTEAGLAAAIPTILSGMVTTASTPAGAQWVRTMIDEGGYGAGTLDKALGMLGGGKATETLMTSGRHMLTSLFGGKQDDVTAVVARSAQLSGSSARRLMTIAAPIVMGVLGREVSARRLDATGIMTFLGAQGASIASVTPAAVANVIGLRAPSAPAVAPAAARSKREELNAVGGNRRGFPAWLLPALAVLAGFALVFAMHPPWGRDVVTAQRTAAPSALPQQVNTLTLPTGEHVDVKPGSSVQQLNAFLANSSDTSVPRRFMFDDLTFEPGSAMLTPASTQTVEALGRTLKAYPAVRVSLEGFTDATGDPAANHQLSLERARVIKGKLIEMGAGFGSDRPVASNDSEDGRARNRRIEVVVTRR
jgi:outer membrane protein OmpA-like peptidoglycan-associated protein